MTTSLFDVSNERLTETQGENLITLITRPYPK